MLGRNSYTKEEVDHAKGVIRAQLAAYKKVREAGAADKKVDAAFGAFDPLFFNNLTLALDRPFVHRVRGVSGKDGNPLNEVEMICDSLMNSDGVFTANTVLKLVPESSVLGLQFGDAIELTAPAFERLSAAFYAELESRFL
jgi:hypothetical protein